MRKQNTVDEVPVTQPDFVDGPSQNSMQVEGRMAWPAAVRKNCNISDPKADHWHAVCVKFGDEDGRFALWRFRFQKNIGPIHDIVFAAWELKRHTTDIPAPVAFIK